MHCIVLIDIYTPMKFHVEMMYRSKTTTGNNSQLRQCKVMVLVQGTSNWFQNTHEVICWNVVTYLRYSPKKFHQTKTTKGNNSYLRKLIYSFWDIALIFFVTDGWTDWQTDGGMEYSNAISFHLWQGIITRIFNFIKNLVKIICSPRVST